MDLKKTLKELTEGTAISGREYGLSSYIKEQFLKYCDSVEVDKFYNVIGVKKGSGKEKKKIMISAHYDEIGFLVKSIDENGFIRIANIGGIDSKVLLAQEVVIHGSKEVFGVIGSKPPHLLEADDIKKATKIEDLYVDVGMNKQKVSEIISVGDYITFKTRMTKLKGKNISSKTMDNRCGVAVLIKTLHEVSRLKHDNDIYVVATTQEEVGLRGAIIASYNLEPDLAVVVDGCMGSYPTGTKDRTYDLSKGPCIAKGPNLNRYYTKKLIDLAKDRGIAYQIDVEPGNTGTEAWAIQVSRSGVPTLLVSIPLRYMHTAIETINISDVKNTSRLIAEFISTINFREDESACI